MKARVRRWMGISRDLPTPPAAADIFEWSLHYAPTARSAPGCLFPLRTKTRMGQSRDHSCRHRTSARDDDDVPVGRPCESRRSSRVPVVQTAQRELEVPWLA